MGTVGYSCESYLSGGETRCQNIKSQTMGIEYVYNNKCIYMNYNLF